MHKPIIGIVAKEQKHREDDHWHRLEMVDELRCALVRQGAVTIMLLPSHRTMLYNQSDLGDETKLTQEEKEDLYRQADLCDGILLQGGDFSCQYEVEIAEYALKKDIPLLGICAGFNNILRMLGSKIREDQTRSHSRYDLNYRHPIHIEKESMLHEILGRETYEVNSYHVMIAEKEDVEGFARISACSSEGWVEAFELEDRRFVMGIKWHPELMNDRESEKLFAAFTEACRKENG